MSPRRRRGHDHRQGNRRRVRRLRGQPGVDGPVLGRRREQLRHPRHALQPRHAPAGPARPRRQAHRQPARVPRRRRRRPRPAVRWRHRHPARHRALRHRRQPRRSPLLRRGRRHLAQALRILGRPHRAAAGPGRLLPDGLEDVGRVHAVALPAHRPEHACTRWHWSSASTRRPWARRCSKFNAAVQAGTYDPTVLDDCYTAGLEVPKSHWARRIDTPPFYGLPAAPRHHLHLSRPRRERPAPRSWPRTTKPSRASSPPAKRWPATSSAAAISPASA